MIGYAMRLTIDLINLAWIALIIVVSIFAAILPVLLLLWGHGWVIGEHESDLAVVAVLLGNFTGFMALQGMCQLTLVLFKPENKESRPND